MEKIKRKMQSVWRQICVSGIILIAILATGQVLAAKSLDPDADKILQSMSGYLGSLTAFSMNADIDNEIISRDSQKIQLSSFETVVMERPGKFHVHRKGLFGDVTFIFDGKTLTVYGKNLNAYVLREVSGTTDDAIRAVEMKTGLNLPGADLLFSDPYAILSAGLESSAYIGVAYVNGIECHHLAFRKAKVDWQLWVQTGDEPFPMKYVITSKWATGAPQYEVRLREWNPKPRIKAGQFTFSLPNGARRLETIPVNEMGEITIGEGK
jgi:hypothetical protein